jgi:hypothetical protein
MDSQLRLDGPSPNLYKMKIEYILNPVEPDQQDAMSAALHQSIEPTSNQTKQEADEEITAMILDLEADNSGSDSQSTRSAAPSPGPSRTPCATSRSRARRGDPLRRRRNKAALKTLYYQGLLDYDLDEVLASVEPRAARAVLKDRLATQAMKRCIELNIPILYDLPRFSSVGLRGRRETPVLT